MKVIKESTCKRSTYQRSGSKFGTLAALAAACVLLGGQYRAGAWLPLYSDNFNAGPPDTGWLHWDPINTGLALYNAGYGVPLTYSPGPNLYQFKPDGSGGQAYNLTNPPYAYALGLPAPYNALPPLGPARTIAYRSDNYTNFNITADLLPGWAGGINPIDIGGYRVQLMGLIARMHTIGVGTTAGYVFSYGNGGLYGISPYGNFLAIARVRQDLTASTGIPGSGNAASAGNCEYHFPYPGGLDNSKAYRFQFIGKGTHLQGRVYELPNTNTPIAVLDANTAGESNPADIYTNGPCGIWGLSYTDNDLNQAVGPLDMTWDNYTASAHTPYEIRDDFNNGSDGVQTYPPWSAPAWVHYDPLGDNGAAPAATYSFPGGNSYQIFAPVDYFGGAYGAPRAGSFRTEVDYSDFYASVDLVNWGTTYRLIKGLLVHAGDFGLGTSTGITWTQDSGNPVSTTAGDMDMAIITGEAHTGDVVTTGSDSVHFTPGDKYRLTIKCRTNYYTGEVYALSGTNAGVRLVQMVGADTTYPSGKIGLLVNNSDADGPGDATFDNFYVDTAEPRLAYSTDGAGRAVLKWPGTLASIWTLESSSSVAPGATWTEIPASDGTTVHYYYDPATGLNTCTNTATITASAPTYFRLQRLNPLTYP